MKTITVRVLLIAILLGAGCSKTEEPGAWTPAIVNGKFGMCRNWFRGISIVREECTDQPSVEMLKP